MAKKGYESRTLASGKTLVRVVTGYENGVIQRVSKTFDKGALTADVEAWVTFMKGGGSYRRAPSLKALFKEFVSVEEGRLAPYTISQYKSVFTRIVEPGLPATLETITPQHITQMMAAHERYKRTTLQKILHFVKSMYTYAVRRGYLETNPAVDAYKPPKGRRRRISVLTLAEMDKLVGVLDGSDDCELMIKTMALSGLRTGEVRALQPRHILKDALRIEQSLDNRFGTPSASAPKTDNAYRTVKVPATLITELKALDSGAFVFATGYTGLRKRLRKVLKDNGLPHVSPHGLRHSHCTYLLAKGVNILAVSRRLGHHSPAFTLDRYGHYIPSMEEEVMKALGE